MQPLLTVALLAACNKDEPGQKKDKPDPEPQVEQSDPGTRAMARLNAYEYDATMRDLLGTKLTFSNTFPADEAAYGFDNISTVLTTTPAHVEGWEIAADELLDEMFGLKLESKGLYGTQAESAGVTYLGEGMPFGDDAYAVFEGGLSAPFSLPYDGQFEVSVAAFGRPLGGEDPVMEVWINGALAQTFEVDNEQGSYVPYSFITELDDGVHTFEILLANPYAEDALRRSVVIDYLRIDGPLDPQLGRTLAYDDFVACGENGAPSRNCAGLAIEDFGRMAWRRPLASDEVDWALGLYDDAVAAELSALESLRHAFKGLLMSPEFLYRIERDPIEGPVRQLDGYEVATRLAAFAWSSTPDDVLLTAADSGELDTAEGIAAALDEMFADERSDALVDNLASQWFAMRTLEWSTTDTELYPDFDEELRASMLSEMRFLMGSFFRDGAALDTVLNAQTTWVDARLADHYGLPFSGSDEDEWVEVSLAGTGRVGLFGSAGWLMAESRVNGPSAVKRGKWILENLLCSSPPPPPPDVEGMVTIVDGNGSIREQEEQQRSAEYCQTCHSVMDPLGFALWNYDGIGAVRTVDELGHDIDTTVVVEGEKVTTTAELAAWVTADPRLSRCIVEKTLTYALGRPMREADDAFIDQINEDFVASGQTFDGLARSIVTSDAFRLRGAPEVE